MNNKTLIGIVVAAVVVVVLIVVGTRSKSTPGVTPTMSVNSTSVSPSTSPVVTGTPKTLTYAQALEKYGSTRIQFDTTCQAHPSSMVIKKGTAIMLDNRSPKARTVAVGSVKYYLFGYGFRIVVPMSKTYPSTQLVDCGTSQNVASILIEK